MCAGYLATSSRPKITPLLLSLLARPKCANPQGTPVYAWKGESLQEYWWCTLQALLWTDGTGPNLILDDGGDATLLVHLGVEYEKSGTIPAVDTASSAEHAVILNLLHDVRAEKGDNFWHELAKDIRGVSEETTTGVHRLIEREHANTLLFPGINVNDSVTKSKFDNVYGCRHSLVDAIMRATDVLISGKRVIVCGYGDVGKGSAESLRGQFARVAISEVDPICALQACMMGFDVVTLEDVVGKYDIFVTATGNKDIITAEHMMQIVTAIVCNIGHFDNEIDMAGLEKMAKKALFRRSRSKKEPTSGSSPTPPRSKWWRTLCDHPCRRPFGQPGLCDRPSFLGDVCVIHQPDHRSNRASSVS